MSGHGASIMSDFQPCLRAFRAYGIVMPALTMAAT